MTTSDQGISAVDTTAFLRGPYAAVDDELDIADLAVEGRLPERLSGTFVRNGPNPAFAPPGKYHPFDGDGMLHAVYIGDGRARYRNRWIRSAALEYERKVGHAVYHGLQELQMPDPEAVAEAGPVKNPANTNIVCHADRLFALWEAGLPTEFTPELDTVGPCDFGGEYPGAFSAHPKLDRETGELITFGYGPLPPFLRYHVIGPGAQLTHSAEIEIPRSVMIHDFVITETRSVFLDAPVVFDLEAGLAGQMPLQWRPEAGARLGVLPRTGDNTDIVWYEIDPCYVVHFFNAFDDGDDIVIDCCRWDEIDLDVDAISTGPDGRPHRFTIETGAGRVASSAVDDRRVDFPRIDDRRAGRRTEYQHGVQFHDELRDIGQFGSLVRYGVDTDEVQTYRFGPASATSEVVFAPDPDSDSEADGWYLSFVYDAAEDSSTLAVLEAADIEAGPIASVRLPRRVPFGFHAAWFPDSASDAAPPGAPSAPAD